jgi:amidophosphoribosyltransferase
VYGIDMPSANELIAHGHDVESICKIIGADGLIFQSLEDLVDAVRSQNPELKRFETSVFDGVYVTNDIDQAYLNRLDAQRNEASKRKKEAELSASLDLHNEGN